MRIISLISCAFLLASVHGQERFSREEVMEDFQVFRTALEQAHPALHTYYSPVQVEQFFVDAQKRLSYDVSGHTLHRTLLECVSSIRDGHTDISYPSSWNDYMGMNSLVPCRFVIRKGRVFVEKDMSGENLIPEGSELLDINGIDIISLQKRLYAHTPCDGNVQEFKSAINGKYFSKRLAFLFPALQSYELTIQAPGGEELEVTVNGISENVLYEDSRPDKPLEYVLNEEQSSAMLSVHSFNAGNGEGEAAVFYDELGELFKQLRKQKIERLVIDLRGNPGGNNSLAVGLYSYISRGPFTYLGNGSSSYDPDGLYAQHADVHTARTFLYDAPLAESDVSTSEERESVHSGTHILVQPQNEKVDITKNKFAGEVVVLTDALTRSAASIFAAVCKSHDRARIVGQGTGTACDSFCGGGYIKVTLPRSKLMLTIPYERNELIDGECAGFGREVRPDEEIIPTIQDIVYECDPVMEALKR